MKRPTASRPTLISRVPGVKRRPSTNVSVSRTSNARGPTPRTGTFAGWLSDWRGSAMMTTSSGEVSGRPPASRATCGRLSTIGRSARRTALTVSAVAPLRRTIALPGEPLATSVARKPCAMASVITNTATTMAIPPAVIAAVLLRTIIERRL